jgi:hypothetical protein
MLATGWILAVFLVCARLCTAQAAPNIPGSELPGRERERFTPSPVERFMQAPAADAQPLIRYCDDRKARHKGKARSKGRKSC